MKQVVTALFILLSLSILAGATLASVSRPNTVPKEQWGSMKIGELYGDRPYDPHSQGPLGDPLAITIHHTTIPLGTNPPNPEEDMKKMLAIQRYHVSKGWGDVGYHFVLGSDGSIYEGRPLPWMGTHAPPNSRNIGVSVIGDFQTKEYPSSTQMDTVVKLVSWLCDQYDINPLTKVTIYGQTNLAVCGHRDWGSTDCPGDHLYALLPNIRDQVHAELLRNAPAYDSRVSAFQFLPRTLLGGYQFELPLAVRNTGYVAWSWMNLVHPESLKPDVVSVAAPNLQDKESVEPLSNRVWQVSINASSAGPQHLALQMIEGQEKFGPELSWDAQVVAPEDFISQWLAIGPFPAATPDSAYATDYFAGKPLDVLDVMDKTSEAAHGYAVTGEYASGERNYRGEDGERVSDAGRYYRGEETFKLSVKGFKGGEILLRRLIDADTRDQESVVYLDGARFSRWASTGMEQFRLWKNLDLIIPANRIYSRDSMDVRVKSIGTPEWGNTSFMYTLLDRAEPLAAPRLGEKIGKLTWKAWRSQSGVTDLSTSLPSAGSGAVYVAAYVKSPVTKYVDVRTGCTGFVKAWLNGVLAVSGRASAQGFPDTLKGEALLKRGWNRLLVKVALEPGTKELFVRLCTRDGQPLKGLKCATEPVDSTGKQEMIARGSHQ